MKITKQPIDILRPPAGDAYGEMVAWVKDERTRISLRLLERSGRAHRQTRYRLPKYLDCSLPGTFEKAS